MLGKRLRRYTIGGLLVWLPLWATFLVVRFVVELLDRSVSLLPMNYRPEAIFGFDIPGFGMLVTFALLLCTGMVVTNFIGERLLQFGEQLLGRIPLVRSIYQAVKQVLHTIFSSNSQAFRRVLLVRYPRDDLWSVAFQTSDDATLLSDAVGKPQLTVFIPTTPNPTSGFLVLVSADEVRELDMSVDDALKMVISLGVMQPQAQPEKIVLNSTD